MLKFKVLQYVKHVTYVKKKYVLSFQPVDGDVFTMVNIYSRETDLRFVFVITGCTVHSGKR